MRLFDKGLLNTLYEMKLHLLLPSLAFSASGLFAQEDQQAIQQWQSLHPSTLLIPAERYQRLSPEEQQLLGKDIIIFQNTITLEQLMAYDAEKSGEAISGKPKKTDDLDAIKIWLGQHPGVRVIPQSKYATLSDDRLPEAHTASCIVLEGEALTLKDIDNYTQLYGQ